MNKAEFKKSAVNKRSIALLAVFGVVATLMLLVVSAATPAAIADPDSGANIVNYANASNGKAFVFSDARFPNNEQSNLNMIKGNAATRNSMFDNNRFKDVPMSQIKISDLTVPGDIYDEEWNATQYDGLFRVECEISHFAYDDPIVYPGQPGRAHLHMFFGNTDANAYSTYDTLLNKGTGTCNGEDLNRTSYWVPALLDRNGNALIPWEVMVYYKNTNFLYNGLNAPAVPFPENMRMITGSASANSDQNQLTGPGSIPVVSFGCGPAYQAANYVPTIPQNCSSGSYNDSLEVRIGFPSCWDSSKGLYQPDGSNLAFAQGGFWQANCPSSHPVRLSSIMYRLFYRILDYGGSTNGWFLSSDVRPATNSMVTSGTTNHADWFGAWHRDALKMWIDNCNNIGGADCEIGLLDRNPEISLVDRKKGYYKAQRIPVAELAKLCPWKQWDGTARGVATCKTN